MSLEFKKRIGPDPHANGQQTSSCNGCPDIWELGDGDFAVIGVDITDIAGELPATAGCGSDERIVKLPRRILVDARSAIPRI